MERHILSLEGWISSVAILGARLSNLKPDDFRQVEAILARVRPRVIDELVSSTEALNLIQKRLMGSPLYLATRSGNPLCNDVYVIRNEGLSHVDNRDEINGLRQAELMKILRSNWDKAVFSRDGYHFVAPSGIHVEKFLRVSNAITSWQSTEITAYWLLDDIQWADAVVVDTWAISSIVLWSYLELPEQDKRKIVRSIEPYDETTRERIREVIGEVSLAGGVSKILFITSVSCSGKLHQSIDDVMSEQMGKIEARHACLYSFSDARKAIDAYCNVGEKQNIHSADDCPLCAEKHLGVLQIDPKDYSLHKTKEKLEHIGKDEYRAVKDLFKRYPEIEDAFSIHRHDPNDNRHHAFYVDFGKLIGIGEFAGHYTEALKAKLIQADVVVMPRHSRADIIEKLVSDHCALPIVRHNSLILDNDLTAEHRSSIYQAKKLLILDDISLSGSRLNQYNRSLREGYATFGEFTNVAYLVGLARPNANEEWESLRDALSKMHPWQATLDAVEKLILPYWDERQCPWCLEAKALRRIAYQSAEPELWLLKRLTQLEGVNSGIKSPCFCIEDGILEPRAGGGSPIVPAGTSSLGVLFAFASALQEGRINHDLGYKHPEWIVLDPKNLTKRYTEALFQAAFIKCSRQEEWSGVGRKLITNRMLKATSERQDQFLVIEVILQFIRGLLTVRGNEAPISELVKKHCGKHSDAVLREIGLI
jgi:hypothetical protein